MNVIYLIVGGLLITGCKALASESLHATTSEDISDTRWLGITNKDYARVEKCLSKGLAFDNELLKNSFSLCVAAKKEQWNLVTALLRARADVTQCADFLQPLFCAVRSVIDCHSVVKDLLQAKANPNGVDVQNVTPLVWAVGLGHEKNVRALLAHNANPTQLCLLDVIINAEKQLAKIFLMYQGPSYFDEFAISNFSHSSKLSVEEARTKHAFSPLFLAAFQGDVDLIKLLLAARANVHKPCAGYTPLEIAEQGEYADAAQLLRLALYRAESLSNLCKFFIRFAVIEKDDSEIMYIEPPLSDQRSMSSLDEVNFID